MSKNGELRKCCVCGKERYFYLSQIKKGYGRYCSRICQSKKEGVKKKCLMCGKELKQTEGCKTGKYCSYECFGESIRNRVKEVCFFCGKEFERKKCQIDRSKKSFCSKACHDAEQRKGRVESVCKVCGKIIHRRGRRVYKYCSSRCLMSDPIVLSRMAEQNQKQLLRNGPNKLELAGRGIVSGIGIEFEEQVLLFGKFTVDVFVKSLGVVIQWDGDYWHGNPKVYNELGGMQVKNVKQDKACNAYLTKCGIKVLRFWEKDVKKRPEWVKQEIKRELGIG
jgi:very-short-patch-repair endonuclease